MGMSGINRCSWVMRFWQKCWDSCVFQGEESCESATEANILSSLPTHINIIGQAEIFDFCWGMVRADSPLLLPNDSRFPWQLLHGGKKSGVRGKYGWRLTLMWSWRSWTRNCMITTMTHDHGNHHTTHASHAHAVTHAYAHYLRLYQYHKKQHQDLQVVHWVWAAKRQNCDSSLLCERTCHQWGRKLIITFDESVVSMSCSRPPLIYGL